jgi:hypothetical protein
LGVYRCPQKSLAASLRVKKAISGFGEPPLLG